MDLMNLVVDTKTMFVSIVIAVAIVVGVKIACGGKTSARRRRLLKVPLSPFSWWETLKAGTGLRFHTLLLEASREVGLIFQLRSGVVIMGDVDIARDVLNDRQAKKLPQYEMFRFIHGQKNDLLTSDNTFWTHSRKGTAPAFSSNHIRRMTEISLKHIQCMSSHRFEQYATKGESFDVAKEMISLTFDIICEAAFQYEMTSEEKEMFLNEMEIALKECYAGEIPLRWKLGFLIPSVRRAVLARQRLISIAMNIIESYKKLESRIKGTVIDCIMCNEKAYKNDKERAADVLILVLAGHETTAFSLAWTLMELAKNPSIQEDLRNSVKEMAQEDYSKSERLKYVIYESMRLHPVTATGSGRICEKDYTVKAKRKDGSCNDIFIPKGTSLLVSPMVYFRSETYFDHPDEFRPSRWENPSEEAKAAFFPFALGRRNCIGQSLATAELYSAIPRLVSEYQFTLEDEGTEEFFLTLKPTGVRLVAKKI